MRLLLATIEYSKGALRVEGAKAIVMFIQPFSKSYFNAFRLIKATLQDVLHAPVRRATVIEREKCGVILEKSNKHNLYRVLQTICSLINSLCHETNLSNKD